MSYCLNPTCLHPENAANSERCPSCGSKLLLHNRYRVLRALGQGGFGATFLAKDEALPGQPSCVIKQLRPSANAPHVLQMARELFDREARTLGQIGNHPQLPRLLDYFYIDENEQFYLVQEYISGATLQQEVKRNGPLSEAGVKQFLSEILPILEYIHSHHVIHRDIKPANLIRRDEDKKLVLIDFGAVKNQVQSSMNQPDNQSDQTAFTAYAIGTPGFAPPEQMAMRPVYASDIYALGVTCIYLLTGKSPKDLEYNPTTAEMMWRHRVHVSDHLAEVLTKMLAVPLTIRYKSAQEVLRALDLEPYLDSLSQGLLTQPRSGSERSNGYGRGDDSVGSVSRPSGGSSNPSIAQIAADIRKRRERQLAEAQSSYSAALRPRVLTPQPTTVNTCGYTSGSTSTKPQGVKHLNTQALLTAYMKGKRDFAQHNLSTLNLQGTDLSGTNFHSCKLERVNFQSANLYKSDFGRARLNRSNLRYANLSSAYLSHADLEGADLRGADLSYAYLNHANLRGANLCGANLTGATLSPEQLALAKINWQTVRPNGRRGLL
ncbi:MAG: serine/threonine-protein kinase [Nostocaceae cyanobacterium]|nr:serine/threonine-protein kinase [Nostocaceae cyanobacterium]